MRATDIASVPPVSSPMARLGTERRRIRAFLGALLFAGFSSPASADSALTSGETQLAVGQNAQGIATGGSDDQVVVEGNLRVIAPDDVPPEAVTHTVTSAEGVVTNAGSDVVETPGELEAHAEARDAQRNDGRAEATARGVDAGAGSDTVTSSGSLTVRAGSRSEALGSFWSQLRRSVAEAVANALGMEGGNDADTLTDGGATEVAATATVVAEDVHLRVVGRGGSSGTVDPTTASAGATAMSGGVGNDTLTTETTAELEVDAVANASSDGGSVSLAGFNVHGVETRAEARATGMRGGKGDDTLHHQGLLDVYAEAGVDELDVEVTALGVTGGSDDEDEDLEPGSDARATGLRGDTGADTLGNDGELQVSSLARSTHTGVAITGPGYARPSPAPGASAESIGLDGGFGADELSNPTGRIHVRSEAENTTDDVAISVLGIAGTFNGSNTADARATGIAGGAGIDTIQTPEGVSPPPPVSPADPPPIHAEAIARAASRDLSIGVLQSADVAAAPLAAATARGIDAGDDDDTVTNDRTMRVESTADSSAISAEIRVLNASAVNPGKGKLSWVARRITGLSDKFLTVAGLVVDNEVTSEAASTGIAGGAGSDTLVDRAGVDARSSATSSRVGIGISVGTGAVVGAGTRAVADATGIDGHGGPDPIEPNLAQRIAAGLPFLLPFLPPFLQPPVQPAPDLGDTIENRATLSASSRAHATSTAVGVGITIGGSGSGGSGSGGSGGGGGSAGAAADAGGGGPGAAADAGSGGSGAGGGSGSGGKQPSKKALNSKIRVKASSAAEATAAGIRGGAASDVIDNHGVIDLAGGETDAPRGGAHAEADANSVAVEIVGCKTCYAAADALVSARSSAAGIDGEADADTIRNHADIDVLATSDARALQVAFTTQGAAIDDVSLKFDWTDTKKAEATAAGIAGGAGADTLSNEASGTITATADSESRLHEVAVAAKGVSLSISSALAEAEATGIDGAGGATLPEDTDSLIEFVARSVDRLVGLLPFEIPAFQPPPPPPDLADTIENRGLVEAVATAESKVIDVAGTYRGVALSTDSLWDNGVASVARAEGIDGGDGNDVLTNFSAGRIDAKASAFTREISGSLVYQGLAATSSSAHATAEGFGIRGGAGNDRVTNEGTIFVGDHALEGIQALARGYQASLAIKGVAAATDPIADAGVHANASALGIAGDAGDDTLVNHAATDVLSTSRAFGLSGSFSYEGVNVTNTSVQSRALASGLAGDSGADTLSNHIGADAPKLRAESNAHATGVKLSASFTGGALTVDPFWHAGTRSDAEALGLDGGSGADTLTNGALILIPEDDGPLGTLDSRVEAEANAVTWGVDIAGAVKGFAGVLASNEAVARATGMQGGADPEPLQSRPREFIDNLTETLGLAYREFVLGETPVVEEADAADILTNYGTIDARADARSRGIEVGLNYQGVAAVADPFADTGTLADAVARAIAGGVGDDHIFNHGDAAATADSGAFGVSGTFTYTGVAVTSATSRASSRAAGLSGGEGADTLDNDTRDTDETLRAEATATATGLRGAVAAYGVAGAVDPTWNAGTRADATALGIDGGAGADTLTHRGALEAVSDASANGVSVAGGAYGLSVTAVDWEAHADATGLRGGADGDSASDGNDTIVNLGSIRSEARSLARGFQGNFEFGGVAASLDVFPSMGSDAESHAQALAGGAGDDDLTNFGSLDTDAVSTSWGIAANVSVYGVAATVASRSALADARGLDGGDGADELTQTRGLFDIDADAQATGIDGSFTFTGVNVTADPFWTDGTTSTARATGLHGGAGADDLLFGDRDDPEGDVPDGLFTAPAVGAPDVDVRSEANTFNLDAAITVIGLGGASMDTLADANAWGAHGGAGLDDAENRRHLKVEADATSRTFEWSVTGVGLAAAVSPALEVGSDAVAKAVGMAGGGAPAQDDPLVRDVVHNRDAIDVDAKSRMVSNSTAISLAGWASTGSSIESNATAWGLDGDGGPSLLLNEGGLDVLADATAVGVDVGFSVVGQSESGGAFGTRTFSHAEAAGGHGGTGNDEIVNQLAETTDATSPFDVKAKARTTSVAVDVTGALITIIGTEVSAEADAYGLEGGEGDDELWNFRPMSVEAEADVRGAEVGVLILGAGFNDLGMGRYGDARATGLDGGEGNDFASNEGRVTVISNSDARATRVQAVGAGYSKLAAYTDSYAKATGMDGDAGDDHLINRGTLDLDADATTTTADVAAALIGSLDTSVWSGARADAEGMQGWFGKDVLENYGSIVANAHAEPSSKNVEAAIIGEPKADTVALATARASGLDAGGGESGVLQNHADASIDVDASARARAGEVRVAVLGNALGGAAADAEAEAYGLFGFEGFNRMSNAGEIEVLADADAEAGSVVVVVVGGADSDPEPGLEGVAEEPGLLAEASAFGAHGGLGREEIENHDLIDVEANAHTNANGLQVDVGGRARLVSGAEARADAHGIRTWIDPDDLFREDDEPEPDPDVGDLVTNSGTIDVLAISRAHSRGNAITIIGGAAAESVQLADAKAWGIETGDGDDVVANDGTVVVIADSLSSANDGAFGLIGHHTTNGAVTAESTATGIDLGTGIDSLDSQQIRVSSFADLPVDSDSFVPIGASRTDGLATATARATGAAGRGDNHIVNRDLLSSFARSSAFVGTDSGAISAGVTANATGNATAWGADLGAGDDRIENLARLGSRAQVTNASDTGRFEANANAKGLSASARADARATVAATGARMGDGADVFWNAEEASTHVLAKVRLEAESAADAASTSATSFVSTSALATGLDLGAGDDVAEIAGTFEVTSDPDVVGTADALGAPGDAQADARSTGRAWGLRLGEGDDEVEISGSVRVEVDADAYADADGDGVGDADGDGDARSRGHAVGIELGTGGDVVEITGSLEVESRVGATGVGDGDGAGEGDAYAGGFSRATAIKVLELTDDDAANDAQAIADAGDKTIINRGTIVATNELSLAANGSSGWRGDAANPRRVGNEQAFGIQTADGDDVVENHGILEAFSVGGAAGIAIDTGAGDDRVVLGAGSRTLGAIRLRAGDDEVEIEHGFELLRGSVEAGVGDLDRLTFRGAGRFERTDFHDFDALRKTGPGEHVVATLPGDSLRELRVEDGRLRIEPSVSGQVRDIRIERGELELMQSFAFREDGRLAVQVFPDGSSGLMLVNGTAGLDGVLEIFRADGVFTEDVSFDVLRARGFTGGFDQMVLPEDLPLLDFELGAAPAALSAAALDATTPLVFSVDVLSFASVASNPLHGRIGAYLDPLLPSASGDVLGMLGEFQNLADVEALALAFSSVSPDTYDGTTLAGLDSARECARAFQRRTERLREEPGDGDPETGTHGPWVEGSGRWSERDGDDGFAGYDADSAGARVGYDREIGNGLVAGLGVCYENSDLDFEVHRATADIDSVGGFAYGTWFGEHAYLDTSLGYARQWYDQRRALSVGTLSGAASSDHHGDVVSASAGSGWRFRFGGSNVQPFGSLYFLHLDQDGFSESGPSGSLLEVDSNETASLVSDLGVRFWHPVELGFGQILPRVSAAWSHDFDVDDRELSASILGAPGSPFEIDGQSIDRDGAQVEAGVGFQRGPFSLRLDYQGGFSGDATRNGVTGGVEYRRGPVSLWVDYRGSSGDGAYASGVSGGLQWLY